MREPERCYCGDPDCSRCYPGRQRRRELNEDDEYDRYRQEQLDERAGS